MECVTLFSLISILLYIKMLTKNNLFVKCKFILFFKVKLLDINFWKNKDHVLHGLNYNIILYNPNKIKDKINSICFILNIKYIEFLNIKKFLSFWLIDAVCYIS